MASSLGMRRLRNPSSSGTPFRHLLPSLLSETPPGQPSHQPFALTYLHQLSFLPSHFYPPLFFFFFLLSLFLFSTTRICFSHFFRSELVPTSHKRRLWQFHVLYTEPRGDAAPCVKSKDHKRLSILASHLSLESANTFSFFFRFSCILFHLFFSLSLLKGNVDGRGYTFRFHVRGYRSSCFCLFTYS